jgi:glycosyltransferase involved in cell wall biosynthesis
MNQIEKITVLIINYKTENLTRVCVDSLLAIYPTTNLLLIDNGSKDDSTRYISELAAAHANIACILNSENLYHGPAMDQGIKCSRTPYVFTLDSDCYVHKAGFLELMLDQLLAADFYAVGRLQHKNLLGYDVVPESRWRIDHIDPHAMLLDKVKYLQLPPFCHHGAPCLRNMGAALKLGLAVGHCDVSQYIFHIGQGTCSRYGYGLGWSTSLAYWVNRLLFDS